MAQRSTSTLDEETALAVALKISEDEARSKEAAAASRAPPEPIYESPQIKIVVPSNFGETAAPPDTAETFYAKSLSGPGSPHGVPASPDATSPSSRENGSYPAFAPDHSHMESLQGAQTRRHILRQNSMHLTREDSIGDKERLLANLALYDLMQKEVKGDGNCQFRALSDQLYHTPKFHSEIRQYIVKQLKSCPELYKGFTDDEYYSYVVSMAKDGTWGDHITLQAAADTYGMRILIVSSFQEECIIEILPHDAQQSMRTLYLSFWHEVHYGSIYPKGSTLSEGTPTTFGSKHLYRFIHKPAPQNMGVLHI